MELVCSQCDFISHNEMCFEELDHNIVCNDCYKETMTARREREEHDNETECCHRGCNYCLCVGY